METAQLKPRTTAASGQQLVSIIRDLLNSHYPNPEGDPTPGPWGPIINGAIRRSAYSLSPVMTEQLRSSADHFVEPLIHQLGLTSIAGNHWTIIAEKHPAIWDIIGGGLLAEVALNPQPLPPVFIFASSLALEIINQAMQRQQVSTIMRGQGGETSIIIVGGLVDEICGNGFRIKYPLPTPHPNWFKQELSGPDLVVMGVQFEKAARLTQGELANAFNTCSRKLMEKGMSKLE